MDKCESLGKKITSALCVEVKGIDIGSLWRWQIGSRRLVHSEWTAEWRRCQPTSNSEALLKFCLSTTTLTGHRLRERTYFAWNVSDKSSFCFLDECMQYCVIGTCVCVSVQTVHITLFRLCNLRKLHASLFIGACHGLLHFYWRPNDDTPSSRSCPYGHTLDILSRFLVGEA